MLVTIILLVKNGERYLAESLVAIFAQKADFVFQVLAIDSGSQDRSKEILARFPVLLHEIAPEQFNHGETRNLGAQLRAGHRDPGLSDPRCHPRQYALAGRPDRSVLGQYASCRGFWSTSAAAKCLAITGTAVDYRLANGRRSPFSQVDAGGARPLRAG